MMSSKLHILLLLIAFACGQQAKLLDEIFENPSECFKSYQSCEGYVHISMVKNNDEILFKVQSKSESQLDLIKNDQKRFGVIWSDIKDDPFVFLSQISTETSSAIIENIHINKTESNGIFITWTIPTVLAKGYSFQRENFSSQYEVKLGSIVLGKIQLPDFMLDSRSKYCQSKGILCIHRSVTCQTSGNCQYFAVISTEDPNLMYFKLLDYSTMETSLTLNVLSADNVNLVFVCRKGSLHIFYKTGDNLSPISFDASSSFHQFYNSEHVCGWRQRYTSAFIMNGKTVHVNLDTRRSFIPLRLILRSEQEMRSQPKSSLLHRKLEPINLSELTNYNYDLWIYLAFSSTFLIVAVTLFTLHRIRTSGQAGKG